VPRFAKQTPPNDSVKLLKAEWKSSLFWHAHYQKTGWWLMMNNSPFPIRTVSREKYISD